MKFVLLAVIIATIGFQARAVEICDDLYASTCSSKDLPADPSGKILSLAEVAAKLKNAREKMRPRLLEMVRAELKTNAQFKKAVGMRREQDVADLLERETMGGEEAYRKLGLLEIYSLIGEPGFVKMSAQASDEFHLLLTPKNLREDIEGKFFDRLKTLAKARVGKLQMPDDVREKILARLDKIELHTGRCGLIREDRLYPDTLTFSGLNDDIRICEEALFRVNSRIALAGMIIHELGHPFDPCHIADRKNGIITYVVNRPRDAQYPIEGLIECLRDSKAGGAKFNENCSDDQIGENMADWFRAEVLPQLTAEDYKGMTLEEVRAAYRNVAWRTCAEQGKHYASGEVRINGLLGSQPLVRDQLGCSRTSAKYTYCDSPAAGNGASKSTTSEVIK